MIIKDIQYTIPLSEVLLRLKYNVKKSEMSETVRKVIDEMLSEAYILSEPQAVVEEFEIAEIKEHEVMLSGTAFTLRGASLVKHLAGCYKVSLIVCTIGDGCSAKIKELLDAGEVTKAATLDAVASEAVEAVTEAVNRHVDQHADAEGATTVSRFSTGYGDWKVKEQKRIIEALDAKQIGVSVNDACLMLPEKTVSACIGWKKVDLPVRKILRDAEKHGS
jgi:hypothetical protein